METLAIRDTDLVVSKIGLGSWAMGGWMWGGSDEGEAIRTVEAALDKGVSLIDTAPVYGFGVAEEIIGKALAKPGARQRAVLATKAGLEWQAGKIFRNSRPERIRQEIEDSLRRLATDRIDIYQLHWPDPLVPIEETAGVLAALRQEGKIRAIGVSNFSPAQMDAFRKVAPIHTVQPPYNLFERAIEADILPYAQRHGLTMLGYGALCRGLLTGKITPTTRFAGDDLRNIDPKFSARRIDQYLSAVIVLDRFARERYGKTVLALAVRWVIDHPGTVALWGARRPEQLDPIDDVLGWSLDGEGNALIDRIIEVTVRDPVGPEFMAPPSRE